MKQIYMDNSATSYPKPPEVLRSMIRYATDCGASAGRGAYRQAQDCEAILSVCRQRIAQLINAESPDRIVFTANCSDGLNIAIRGVLNTLEAGSHALATAMEHNSVLRPYHALAEQNGLQPEFVRCDPRTGRVDPDDLRRAIRPNTKLISCVHVSNVTGTIQPIEEVAAVARKAEVPCLIDAAQSVGHLPIDVQTLGADFVAFPGHKGLLGPLGTGVLYVRPGAERFCETMKEGGTGTVSEVPRHPQTMPDKYEVGSHNAIGLAGLSAGVAWLLGRDLDQLRAHDEQLCQLMLDITENIDGLTVYGPKDHSLRAGVFSVNIEGLAPGELADQLERREGICARPGVHCAPLAHETIGTHPSGTCRLSFGPFTTIDQIWTVVETLKEISADVATVR